MKHLGAKSKNIDDGIAELIEKGLEVEVKQAMDTLRVFGNNAVHPGELDLQDDVDTAYKLFTVLNFIVQSQITRKKQLDALHSMIPQSSKEAIVKRDNKIAAKSKQ